MKHFEFFGLIFLLLLAIFLPQGRCGDPAQFTAQSDIVWPERLPTSRHVFRWIPVKPIQDEDGILIELPAGSALMIQNMPAGTSPEVFDVFYTGAGRNAGRALIPIKPVVKRSSRIIYPGISGRKCMRFVRSEVDMRGVCFFVSTRWRGYGPDITGTTTSGNEWLSQERMKARKLLDIEDTLSRPLFFSGQRLDLSGVEGTLCTESQSCSIKGPACLQLSFRSPASQNDSLLSAPAEINLSIDGLNLPPSVVLSTHTVSIAEISGARREYSKWSSLIRHFIYIPEGIHGVTIHLKEPVWIAATIRFPFHPESIRYIPDTLFPDGTTSPLPDNPEIRALCTYELNKIPEEQLYDVAWLQAWVRREPDNNIAATCLQNQRNRIIWKSMALPGDRILFVDPVCRLSRVISSGKRSDGYSADISGSEGKTYYRLEPNTPFLIDVIPDATRPDLPVSLRLAELGDRRLYKPPTIRIDDKLRYQPAWLNPEGAPLFLSLQVYPGRHEIYLESSGRTLVTETILPGADIIRGYVHAYSRLPQQGDSPLTLRVSGGRFGTLLRCFRRAAAPNIDEDTILISMDGGTPLNVSCRSDATLCPFAGFELTCPPGMHIFHFWSKNGAGLLRVAEAVHRFPSPPEKQISSSDSSLTQLERYFTFQNDSLQGTYVSSESAIERILVAIDAGDTRNALKYFLELPDSSDTLSRLIVRFYLLLRSGYAAQAANLGEVIVDTYRFSPLWFQKLLLEGLLSANRIDKAILVAADIYRQNPADTDTAMTVAWLWAACGDRARARVILDKLPESMYNKEDYRCLKYALEHPLTETGDASFQLPEDWAVSSRFPVFRPLPASRRHGSYTSLSLVDTLPMSLHRSESNHKMPSRPVTHPYAGLNTGNMLQVNVTGPTVLRWVIRPVSEIPGTSSPETCVSIDTGDGSVLTVPLKKSGPARESLSYGNHPELKPTTRQFIDIPVGPGPALVTIRCISGACAVKPMIQVPGYRDLLRTPPDPRFPIEITHLIRSAFALTSHHSDFEKSIRQATSFAHLTALSKHHPGVRILSGWLSLMRRWMKTRTIHISTNHPIFLHHKPEPLTAAEIAESSRIPSPFPDMPYMTISGNTSLYFTVPETGSESIGCRISTARDGPGDFRLWVLSRGTQLGFLDTFHRQWSTETTYMSTFAKTWRIELSDPGDADLIKITVFERDDKGSIRPLFPVRRYARLNSGESMAVRINGPTVLNIFYRFFPGETDLHTQYLRFRLENPSGSCVMDSSPGYFPQSTCTDEMMQIPVVNSGEHLLIVKATGGAAAVRLTGFTWIYDHRTCNSKRLLSVFHKTTSIPRSRFAPRYECPHPTLPDQQPEHCLLRGTWSIGGEYSHRRNDDTSEGWDIFDTDGITSGFSYRQRLDSAPIYIRSMLDVTRPLSGEKDPVFFTRHDTDIPLRFMNIRCHTSARLAMRHLSGDTELRWHFRTTFFRSFKPAQRWHLIPGITLFTDHQSLTESDADQFNDPPDPRLYTGFRHRHPSGASIHMRGRFDINRHLFIYSRFQTMTGGKEEGCAWGPWWWTGGIKGLIGPIIWQWDYMIRRHFGASAESDRSRLKGLIQYSFWKNRNRLIQVRIEDRYTLETNQNTLQASITFLFNHGRFLRDFNPFRNAFIREIEGMAP